MLTPTKRGIALIAVAAVASLLISFSARAESSQGEYPFRSAILLTGAAASIWTLTSDSVEPDKKQHFGISIIFGAASETILRSDAFAVPQRWKRVALATGLATLPGIAKELSDSRFDTGDLLADVLGSFTGAMMSDLIQGPMQNIYVGVNSDSVSLNWSMQY